MGGRRRGLERIVALSGFMLGIATCIWQSHAAESEQALVLDVRNLKRALVVATIQSSVELRDDEPCIQQLDDVLVMCTGRDVRLRIRVEEVVHGVRLPRYLTAHTFSHWGKMHLQPGSRRPQLMLIETDGANFVIPKYSNRPLAVDRAGALAVPLESPDDFIDWLPCEIGQNRRIMNFVEPVDLVRHLKDDNDYSDETLELADGFLERRGKYFWIVRGISVDSIRHVLSSVENALTHSCSEWPSSGFLKE